MPPTDFSAGGVLRAVRGANKEHKYGIVRLTNLGFVGVFLERTKYRIRVGREQAPALP